MDQMAAAALCRSWLPAWTGGLDSLERLLSHYAPTIVYRDPACPQGIVGLPALRTHLHTLLKRNPHWSWKVVELIPTEAGFVLKWQATIPRLTAPVVTIGLDIVEVQDGLITRHEAYFDRLVLGEQHGS